MITQLNREDFLNWQEDRKKTITIENIFLTMLERNHGKTFDEICQKILEESNKNSSTEITEDVLRDVLSSFVTLGEYKNYKEFIDAIRADYFDEDKDLETFFAVRISRTFPDMQVWYTLKQNNPSYKLNDEALWFVRMAAEYISMNLDKILENSDD